MSTTGNLIEELFKTTYGQQMLENEIQNVISSIKSLAHVPKTQIPSVHTKLVEYLLKAPVSVSLDGSAKANSKPTTTPKPRAKKTNSKVAAEKDTEDHAPVTTTEEAPVVSDKSREAEEQSPSPPQSESKAKAAKRKREKDPNAPKHPASAYILFFQEHQNAVRNQMITKDVQDGQEVAVKPSGRDVGSKIGSMWRELSEEAKKPYVERAAAAMQIYNAEKEKYEAEKGLEPDAKRTKAAADIEMLPTEPSQPEVPSSPVVEPAVEAPAAPQEAPVVKKRKPKAKKDAEGQTAEKENSGAQFVKPSEPAKPSEPIQPSANTKPTEEGEKKKKKEKKEKKDGLSKEEKKKRKEEKKKAAAAEASA